MFTVYLVTRCAVFSDGDETNGRSGGGAGDGDVMDVTDVTDHYEFVASDDDEWVPNVY